MIASCSGYLSPSQSTDSTSTRYSHLSLLTSSSSVSSAATAPSPLPSPSTSVHSIGSKTHAFFSSPFEGSPTPLPPPNPPTRVSSIRSQASVSSLYSPTSSASCDHDGCSKADETPRIHQRVPKRSLNAEFFGPSLLPTPPPRTARLPLSPSDSREGSLSPPPTRQTLPPIPLSRLFPSRRRYGTEDARSREPSPHHRREFVEHDNGPPPNSHLLVSSPAIESVTVGAPMLPDSIDLPTPLALPAEAEGASYVTGASESKPLPPLPSSVSQGDETESQVSVLEAGTVLKSASLSLRLERVLGHGAFSSVWLARDVDGQLKALELSRKTSLLRSRSEKRGRRKRLEGTRPRLITGLANGEGGAPLRRGKATAHARKASDESAESVESVYLSENREGGRSACVVERKSAEGRLVAVKMTERALCEKDSRSRVSFVREVEILRHISHPSIISYVHSFSTPSHHCLVLEYVGGGELFDLINNSESHARLDEPLVRRIWGELCKAVGWMHGVGLVHRDIKLENILLTTSIFSSPLPTPPSPLVKLSDFGLSRFIDPAQPLLTTLCGSESYAAPELVTGRPYDGRETDAWACGVVLYALATRRLPFDKPRARVASREREMGFPQREAKRRDAIRMERRALLMRIAKAEYSWPEQEEEGDGIADGGEEQDGRLTGTALVRSQGLRRMVERLLVRDPKKRSKIIDLWEDEWMHGEGAPLAPLMSASDMEPSNADTFAGVEAGSDAVLPEQVEAGSEADADQDADVDADVDADDEGLIVDEHDIGPGSVAHQEH
ncbi:kinase-like protein [Laetiporus sulphureus 93-53]|uniref:Kinase-like protein n=1 Tax=Laetiporus sulphureus 93-53 TaxID=1314785 RepID=A0A165CV16_9APHY|nr:kinase-like protein [Laetiporus sulphureus 93-53]KZT03478.1 kinase-like protein [Laetiporus sulphureus 93-53]